ncbi:hypothetical protein ABE450_002567 [Clostridium perfringens]|jgi:hypothetical protein|uniref:hypothetical protein n=1 Tax=Clostridium perfringens TaxID=1502 RepID=UPI001A336137|nr:hypothetical protein [Clostridium perfringens]HAT4137261.1 hypothetical protein [Clostridium perfringens]HBI7086406.1 hypothetical protein [Clostridium perfringens]
MWNFSDEFNLRDISGHADLEFIDINLEKDTKLFLDPLLIESNGDEWCKESNMILNNYFDNVFEAYKNNQKDLLYELFSFGREPNETFLGLSECEPKGKGNSADGLMKVFEDILNRGLMEDSLIKKPMDLCVFVHDFAEDGMSDLVTNVLRKKLNEFTLAQCEKYSIPVSDNKVEVGASWNSATQSWETVIDNVLLYEGKNILLVPKNIVRKSYVYSVEKYLNKKILEHRQRYHLQNNTSLTTLRKYKNGNEELMPPSKKTLRKVEMKDTDSKEFVTEYTKKNPKLIEEFRDEMYSKSNLGKYNLQDEELDEIVYGEDN